MSVTNGQPGNQNTFNNAFISRTDDSDTTGVVGLNNTTDVNSGDAIVNTQRAVNETMDTVGMTGEGDATRKNYASQKVVTNGDDHKVAIGKLDAEFNETTGHAHSGAAGDGVPISAANLSNFNKFFAYRQLATFTGAAGTSDDVSASFSGKTDGGGVSALGVITSAPNNLCILIDQATGTNVEDGTGKRVYGRLTFSSSVWTLSYVTLSPETSHSMTSTDIDIYFTEVFNQSTRPTIAPDPANFGTVDLTADVVDASSSVRGVVSTGAQTFAGDKTFNGHVLNNANFKLNAFVDSTTTGTTLPTYGTSVVRLTNAGLTTFDEITASTKKFMVLINDTGAPIVVTDSAGGADQIVTGTATDFTFADGAAIILYYDDADTSWRMIGGGGGGGISDGGDNIFTGSNTFQGGFAFDEELLTTSGSDQELTVTKTGVRVTDSGLVSVGRISTASNSDKFMFLTNKTGNPITVIHQSGSGTAANRIVTPNGVDLPLLDGESAFLFYSNTDSRWIVLGKTSTSASSGNMISNGDADVSAAGWTTYADAAGTTPVDGTGGSPTVTWTRSTTTPLNGAGSFLLTKDAANRQGEGAAYAFSIPKSHQGKPLQVQFDWEISSGTFVGSATPGTNSDVTVWVYDVTNSVLVPVVGSLLEPAIAGQYYQFKGSFQAPINSTSYRLIFHVATTSASAYTLKIDDISVSRPVVSNGAAVTDLKAYSPTSNITTNVTTTGFYQQIGDRLYGEFLISFSGTNTQNVNATISIPDGLVIDTTKLTNSASDGSEDLGSGTILDAGTANFPICLKYASATTLSIRVQNAASTYSVDNVVNPSSNVPMAYASGDKIQGYFWVPIVGWSSNVQMSNDTDTRVVSFAAYESTTAASTVQNFIYTGVDHNTHGTYSTVTGKFTVPVSGKYFFGSTYYTGSTHDAKIYRNGNIAYNGTATDAGTVGYVSGTFDCVAGDEIEIRPNASVTATTGPSLNNFFGFRMSGPSQIAASEKVVASYGQSSGQNINNTTATITWNSKFVDTHSAMSSPTFTAPSASPYKVSVRISTSPYTLGTTSWDTLSIRKNGSAIAYGHITGNGASAARTGQVETIVNMLAGDTLDAQFGTTANVTLDGSANGTQILIERI